MPAGFWSDLQLPILGLSPMDGVTDHPFRQIQKKYGKPAVVYTEFTSVEGVCHGADRLLKDFLFDESQRPIVAQIYGTTPDFFRQTAIVLCELGFDGIDINMGCPAKNVAHSGAGAALIKTPKLAQEIIRAVQTGIEQWQNGAGSDACPDITKSIWQQVELRHAALPTQYQQKRIVPVSVKTRVGFDQPVIAEWIPTLLETKVSTLALHGRTLKQHYSGEASWELIGQAAELCRGSETLILGNGDVKSREQALEQVAQYGVDGVLLGRATFGDPFVFLPQQQIEPIEKARRNAHIAVEHAQLFETVYSSDEKYNFLPMRKHLGWYMNGFPNASEVRVGLFKTNSAHEVQQVLSQNNLL